MINEQSEILNSFRENRLNFQTSNFGVETALIDDSNDYRPKSIYDHPEGKL